MGITAKDGSRPPLRHPRPRARFGPPAFARHGTVIDPRDLDDGSDDCYVPEPPRYGVAPTSVPPDACLGGEQCGSKCRRGLPDKTPLVAGLVTIDEGHPLRVKRTMVAGLGLPAERNRRLGAAAPEPAHAGALRRAGLLQWRRHRGLCA